jgi:hypothetical protein
MHRDARIPCKNPKRLRHSRAVSFLDAAISLSILIFKEHHFHVVTRRAALLEQVGQMKYVPTSHPLASLKASFGKHGGILW